jgi:DNA-binding MarR family transcriptional regulator
MQKTTAQQNKEIAFKLSNNLARLLREFSKDYERRIYAELANRGFTDVRSAHGSVFANLGMGAVRVTELAERAQVTQQAMGKMLKELEQMGYISRDIDPADKRAKEIKMTDRGVELTMHCLEVADEVHAFYTERIGAEQLAELEGQLRDAVNKLGLEYLPESWVNPALNGN